MLAGDQLWAMPDLEFKCSMPGCIFESAQLCSCCRSCLLSLGHPLPKLMHLLVACPSLQSAIQVYLHALPVCHKHDLHATSMLATI